VCPRVERAASADAARFVVTGNARHVVSFSHPGKGATWHGCIVTVKTGASTTVLQSSPQTGWCLCAGEPSNVRLLSSFIGSGGIVEEVTSKRPVVATVCLHGHRMQSSHMPYSRDAMFPGSGTLPQQAHRTDASVERRRLLGGIISTTLAAASTCLAISTIVASARFVEAGLKWG
jgi:hypothetical protein